MSPITLPSASFTDAVSLPPPTSLTGLEFHGTGGEELAERCLDVVDVPIADWPGHPLGVPVRSQTDVLITDVVPDVVRRVHRRRDTQQRSVHRLGAVEILDREDDRSHS